MESVTLDSSGVLNFADMLMGLFAFAKAKTTKKRLLDQKL
ncbi:hypothetical protein NMS_2568 [Nonlabens marinus S1-08]|uniref:Uncharacterized protein n=1 Tax=Nonlabens marinus S1-08 TaxID=1454201 RepID=W8VXV3_9FLAO|nr:hypothetical protein NMS_2568 [Nonlabens marinus S1-08]